jgi:hypothetical protein
VSRAGVLTVALVACLALLAACSGEGTTPSRPDASDSSPTQSSSTNAATASCSAISGRLVRAVQRYVDGYGVAMRSSRAADQPPAGPGNEDLQKILADSQADLQETGCDLDSFRGELEDGLEGVTARGPLARAVLLRLRASMTGRAATTASTITARPTDDLAEVLAGLAPDSVVRLAPGRHRLSRTLVVLQGVTIVGAGRDRTELVSRAAGSALLVLTDGRVELRRLTARHAGRSAASVLLGGPTASVVLDAVRIADAVGKKGQGGNGVLMTASEGQEQGRGTTLEVTGTEFRGNQAAGVLLTGGHRASVRRSTFVGNGQCGVCFADRSAGAVRTSRFARNDVGVAVLDGARPALLDDRFVGGQVGVQASGRSRPLVRASSINGAARAAMIFSERATGRVDRSTCTEVPYGIVVSGRALPFVGDNDCTIARSP